MEKRQTTNENKEDTANALKQKTNQDFNGKKPIPNDPSLQEEETQTEVPGIGDDKKKNPGEIVMDKKEENKSTGEYKPESPAEEEPLNPKPKEGIEGDSDAEQVINKDDAKVF